MNQFDQMMLEYYRVLNNAWTGQVAETARKAITMLSSLKGSDRENLRIVNQMVEMIGHDLGDEFAAEVSKPTKTFMQQSVLAGLRDVQAKVSIGTFGYADERMIQVAQQQQVFWVGNHFDADIKQGFTQAITKALQEGQTNRELAETLRTQFSEIIQKGAPYWQGLAEHTALRIREFGRMQGYRKAGAEGYRLVVVLDDRTSDICRAFAAENKVYPLSTATKVMDSLLELDTKGNSLDDAREYIKALAPWVKDDQVVYDNEDKPIGVTGAHTPFPPFHFRCRTTTEIVQLIN